MTLIALNAADRANNELQWFVLSVKKYGLRPAYQKLSLVLLLMLFESYCD